jgi:hypothetical protein
MSQRSWQRWTPMSGALFVVLIVVGFVVGGSSPDTDAPDAKIAAYLAKSSNQDRNFVAFFILMAAMLALIWFYSTLRSRLAQADGGAGGRGALAFGAGVASAVFLVTAICLFISTVITASDTKKFPVDPGLFRLTEDLGYLLWIASAYAGALAIWATAAVVMRTRALPRWYAWFSIVAGIISLASFLFFPTFVYWLWILVTGILLTARPAAQPSEPLAAPA